MAVADPYLEMHTGPGRGYPIFHVVDRGESVEIIKQRTDWFLVRDADGDEGWVDQAQMELTLNPDGSEVDFERADLQDFTNAHFLAEQLLMRLHSYPGFEAHQREHDDLMEELRGLGETLLADDATDPAEAATSLERWLIAHIQSEDQALAEFLRQQDGES